MAMMAHTSVRETPRMLPNRAASKLRPRRPKMANRARPRAKEAVVITPMAASAPMTRRRVTRLIMRPDATPHTPAPRAKFTPSRALAANPPKMAWDSPWPM